MNENLRNIKDKFRAKHLDIRRSFSPEQKAEYDSRICSALINTMAYKNASQVLMYSALGIEISLTDIFTAATADGKRCFFPLCGENNDMSFRYVDDLSRLSRIESTGIFEPVGDGFEEYIRNNADICIVPALTYDVGGFRMGFGRGFYDRFLSGFIGTKIGVCYSANIERALPKGKFDARVDILITENGLFRLKVKP